jgi:S1-C subfamily serine protease
MSAYLLFGLALAGTNTQPCMPRSGQIEDLGQGRYKVDTQLVSDWTSDMDKAESLAYTAWHVGSDGQRDGFRVRRIRCGNPLDEAGIQNGDVVHSINGQPVTGMTDVFFVWRKVRKADTVVVALSRKDGTEQTLSYLLE